MHALFIDERTNRTQRVVIVGQRLTHPHVHHVRHASPLTGGPTAASVWLLIFRSSNSLHEEHLRNDFADGQVAFESLLPSCAECTAPGAPSLRRHTHGAADPPVPVRRIPHEHGLNEFAVREPEERLVDGSVV